MVAKLKQLRHPVLYYGNVEGGHAGAATNESRAALMAREHRYLGMKLKKQASPHQVDMEGSRE